MSLNLNLKHINIDLNNLGGLKSRMRGQDAPDFFSYKVDFKTIKRLAKEYSNYKNYIIIGNGGSVTSFWAYYKALGNANKNIFILTTMDPDLIHNLKEKYPKNDTLVIAISKSGDTVGVIEDVLAFQEYPVLCITSVKGTLYQIAKKNKYNILEHPEILGRFSGTSGVAYLAAAIIGIKIEDIDLAARAAYKTFKSLNNDAFLLSSALYLLEYNGYSEVFLPIYSNKLLGFTNLIVQLMHESVCKDGKGVTFFCADAPESQHHTNQRFFGGKKNVVGLFMTVEKTKQEVKIKVPPKLQKLQLRNSTLKILSNKKLSNSLKYEFMGTFNDSVRQKIPVAELNLSTIDEKHIGKLIAFWHLVAIYSALLRGVNPFDQPQVEASKNISFELRKK